MSRRAKRIDCKILSTSGRKVEKDSSSESESSDQSSYVSVCSPGRKNPQNQIEDPAVSLLSDQLRSGLNVSIRGESELQIDSTSILSHPSHLQNLARTFYWVKGLSLIHNEIFIRRQLQSKMSLIGKSDLSAAQEALGQDIDYFLDENPLKDCCDTNEITTNIKRVEDLRTAYRMKHNEYKNDAGELYNESMAQEIGKRLHCVKNYNSQC